MGFCKGDLICQEGEQRQFLGKKNLGCLHKDTGFPVLFLFITVSIFYAQVSLSVCKKYETIKFVLGPYISMHEPIL